MNEAEKYEEQVRKHGGPYSEEIIRLIRELAEVDVEIKKNMDEIERIDEAHIRRHNLLSDRINALAARACEADRTESVAIFPDTSNINQDATVRVEFRFIDLT